MSAVSISATPHVIANAVVTAGHGIAEFAHAFFEFVSESLTRSIAENERERDEAYLAQAVDHFDLERRMRELDYGRRHQAFAPY